MARGLTVLGFLLVAGAAGFVVTVPDVDPRIAIFVFSACLAAGFAYLGRADLSRLHIALPTAWYTAVAVAQLKLLNYETAWSPTATWLVLVGPLLFALGAWMVSRGVTRPVRSKALDAIGEASTARLLVAGVILLALGVVGAYMKSRITGGLLLLSDDIDRNRGGVRVPGWVTLLTDCAFIAFWLFVLRLARPGNRAVTVALAAAALVLVALNASRNTLLVALAVPIIFCYLTGVSRRLRGRAMLGVVALTLLGLLTASGLFYLRTSQHQDTTFERYFYSDVVSNTAVPLRPFLPIYISLATPFETYNRVTTVFPSAEGYGNGGFSTYGIPPVISPFERRSLYDTTGQISRPYYFNVATYQASLFADGGWLWVCVGSLLLGAALGAARAWLVERDTIASMAVAAYLTYLVLFFLYENVLGLFTVSVVWDVLVVSIALAWCSAAELPRPRVAVLSKQP